MTTKEKPNIPMYDMYKVEDLATSLGRSEQYLMDLKWGKQPLRDKFKWHCATILGKSEEELFGSVSPS